MEEEAEVCSSTESASVPNSACALVPKDLREVDGFPEMVLWKVNVADWTPSESEWKANLELVQPEEQVRIGKFRFEMDRKRALAGRLLIRRAVMGFLNVTNKEVKLTRTDRGKPVLVEPDAAGSNFNFNVSHHGSWVVLAAHKNFEVGVDLMEYEFPRGSNTLGEFFQTMRSSFTDDEWSAIRKGASTDEALAMEHLKRFYVFWSLKESYIKAIGIGIGFGLQRASFEMLSTEGEKVKVKKARMKLDGNYLDTFRFYVLEIDSKHCVAVAVEALTGNGFSENEETSFANASFETVNF